MPEPLKLFISYRSSDAPKVDKITNDLASLRYDDGTPRYITWQDKYNLPPAHPNWWEAILDAIDDSAVFVFHVSQGSLESLVCQAELKYAHERRFPVIPIVLAGEWVLNEMSGKYDLPPNAWALVPDWMRMSQLLFYTGADFYRQFGWAIDEFRKKWPKQVFARRPLNPNINDTMTNHACYAQACDYAERLAFAEAEKLFDALHNDRQYGSDVTEWLELLRRYGELIEVDGLPRSRSKFKPLWEQYIALFPKDFWEGLFDPKGFADRMDATHVVPQPPALLRMTAEAYFARGYEFSSKGDYDRAIADYNEAIRLNPQFAEAYINRGAIFNDIKEDHDRALADYNEAIRLNPQDVAAYNNRGNIYDDKGDYDHAIADYDEAIRLNPQSAESYTNRGVCYKNKNDHDRAITDYNEAIRLDPQLAKAYANRGISYYGKGEYDRAIADYSEAIRLDPQLPLHPHLAQAYSARGINYVAKGEYNRAIGDFDRVLEINPNYPHVADWRREMIEALNTQMAIPPTSTSMTTDEYVERGEEHWKSKRYDEAIADYSEAIRLNPQHVRAHYRRGDNYYYKGEYDKAIADYSEAIRLNPQHTHAHYSRGISYQVKGEYDEAIADYSEAIRLNPEYADAYYSRGNSYIKKGDYDRAIADFDRALEINPKYFQAVTDRQRAVEARNSQAIVSPTSETMTAEAYFARAEEHRNQLRWDEAVAHYSETLRLNPQDAVAYYRRGDSYRAKEEHDQAILDYTEAIRLKPQYKEAYYHRGLSYKKKIDYDRAIADFEYALKIDPRYKYAADYLQRTLEAKKKHKR